MGNERLQNLKAHLDTLRKPRHILALCGILLGCALVFFFVGDAYLDDVADRSERVIVNDDYSVTTGPLDASGELRQTLTLNGGERLYGVNLLVDTYGRVPSGTLHLRLLDQYGDLVARCDTDMSTLLDNTFHRFLFDTYLEADGPAPYHLVITASPASNEDRIAFHRSNGPPQSYAEGEEELAYDLSAFVLLQNGRTVDGTLALQYVTAYAGDFIYTAYTLFAVVLTLFLLTLYVAVLVVGAAAHKVFVYCCLVLGVTSMFLIPPRAAPDEYAHIATAYSHSNRVLSPDWNITGARIMVRGGDEMKLRNYDPDAIGIFAYQRLYEGLFEAAPKDAAPVELRVRTAPTYPVPYLLPTLGVILARLLGLGQVGLLMLGRFANLVFYAVVVSRAVKRMPIARTMLFVAGLLPMCLQLAGSFSPDAFTIALAFYFIAACLDCALTRESVGPRQLVLLGAVAVLLAPAKVVYLLALPLVLIIPAGKFSGRRAAWLGKGAVLAAALVVWGAFSLGSIAGNADADDTVAYPPDAESGFAEDGPSPDDFAIVDGEVLRLRPNGDSVQHFTPGYILTHLPKTLRLLARSLWEQGSLWLQGLLGGRLGEVIAVDITVNWLFVIALLGVLLCATLPDVKDNLVLPGRQRAFLLGLTLAVAAALLAASLVWTPANYRTLFGMQGRYLLPVLPLALLAVRGENLRFFGPMRRPLGFAAVCLALLCQLDAFTKILQL